MWIKVMSTLRWSEAAFVIYHLIYWRCKAGPVAGEQPRTASVSEPSRCVCIHRPAHTCRHKLPTMLVEVRDQLSNGFLNHLPLSIWGRVFPWTWTLPTHFSRLSEQQTPGPLLSLNAEIFFSCEFWSSNSLLHVVGITLLTAISPAPATGSSSGKHRMYRPM